MEIILCHPFTFIMMVANADLHWADLDLKCGKLGSVSSSRLGSPEISVTKLCVACHALTVTCFFGSDTVKFMPGYY